MPPNVITLDPPTNLHCQHTIPPTVTVSKLCYRYVLALLYGGYLFQTTCWASVLRLKGVALFRSAGEPALILSWRDLLDLRVWPSSLPSLVSVLELDRR